MKKPSKLRKAGKILKNNTHALNKDPQHDFSWSSLNPLNWFKKKKKEAEKAEEKS